MVRLINHRTWGRRAAATITCCLALALGLPSAASAVGLPFVDLPSAGSVATDAIDAATTSIVGMVADGVAALTNEIIKASDTIGTPHVDAGNSWFTASYRRTVGVSLWLMAIAALIAIVSAGVRGKIGDMVGVLLVNVPGAVVAMMLVTVGVDLALGLVDAMTAYTFRSTVPQIQQFLHDVGTTFASYEGAGGAAADVLAPGLALIIGLFVIMAQLAILAVLVIRSALIYIVTLFLPLVFAVQVWPATRHMTRKAIELLAVLVLSKFAIFTCFALGAGAYTSAGQGTAPPIQSAIIGLGVMAAAAFSPMLLMSIIPGIAGSFGAPPAGMGARGAVGVSSSAQVMRSTLASVHPVRRSRHASASQSTSTSPARTSMTMSQATASESAHTSREPLTTTSTSSPQGAAVGATPSTDIRSLHPPVGESRVTPQTGSAGPHDITSGPSAPSQQMPASERPAERVATAPTQSNRPTVPPSAQTADGFSSVSTRQPFTLEST